MVSVDPNTNTVNLVVDESIINISHGSISYNCINLNMLSLRDSGHNTINNFTKSN